MSLLEIRNLKVEFDTAKGPFRALDGVDYTVDAGEVLAIVGESGSGKSVAMLATMGLLPDTATITADKMDFEGSGPAHPVCQGPPQGHRQRHLDDLPGAHRQPQPVFHGRFPAGRNAEGAHGAERQADQGPGDRADDLGWHPRSGRTAQCVPASNVGRPVPARHDRHGDCLFEPKLLIADEPTTALDVTIQKQILDLLVQAAAGKRHGPDHDHP